MSVALPPTAPAPAQADFVLHGAPSAGVRQQLAEQDLQEGLSLWRLFLTLGWLDIRLRYRGSVLGPFWLTLSTGPAPAVVDGRACRTRAAFFEEVMAQDAERARKCHEFLRELGGIDNTSPQ